MKINLSIVIVVLLVLEMMVTTVYCVINNIESLSLFLTLDAIFIVVTVTWLIRINKSDQPEKETLK